MLKGKSAIVTGSTSGIGLGIARAADLPDRDSAHDCRFEYCQDANE